MARVGRGSRIGWGILGILLAGGVAPAAAQEVPPVFFDFQLSNPFDPQPSRFDDSIEGFFEFEKDFLSVARNSPRLRDAFDTFTDEARAAVDQVPIPSGSVSVSYEFDATIDSWVREVRPFSPSLSFNARTDGKGILTFGFGYSHLEYQSFEGQGRDDVVLVGRLSRPDGTPAVDPEGRQLLDVSLFQFKLRQTVTTFSAQWGVTDWLDVGVLVPVFDESFRARTIERFFLQNPDGSLQPGLANADYTQVAADERFVPVRNRDSVNLSSFNVPGGNFPLLGVRTEQDEYGIGDLLVRTKLFLGSANDLDFAVGTSVWVPTGEEEDLFGVGSVRVDPRLIISRSVEKWAGHVNLGYHADVEEADRNRFDYSVGGELQLLPGAAILIDQVGRIELHGNQQVRKFDIVPGLKVNPWGELVIGFNALLPLNDNGLRTDFTPNATVEFSIPL